MTFGKRITQLRKEMGYTTRKKFAEKLSIPETTLRNYEMDSREPGHTFLKQLSDIFNVSTDYLLGLTEEREKFSSHQLKASEYSHIKKYRFISQYSINGTNMVDVILDKEYMMAENRKNLEEEIKELKSRLDSKEVHMPEMPNDIEKYEAAKKAKDPTEHSKYVNKDTDYVNAAHPIAGASEEDKQFDEDIMNDEDF